MSKQVKHPSAAQELLLTRQITREIVIERLLSIIDLPVIEQLLVIDESNDIDYKDLMGRIECKLGDEMTKFNVPCVDENQHIFQKQSSKSRSNSSSQRKKSPDSGLDSPASPPAISYAHRSLAILSQTHEMSKCDT